MDTVVPLPKIVVVHARELPSIPQLANEPLEVIQIRAQEDFIKHLDCVAVIGIAGDSYSEELLSSGLLYFEGKPRVDITRNGRDPTADIKNALQIVALKAKLAEAEAKLRGQEASLWKLRAAQEIVHDIRNPLTVVLCTSEMIEADLQSIAEAHPDDETAQRALSEVTNLRYSASYCLKINELWEGINKNPGQSLLNLEAIVKETISAAFSHRKEITLGELQPALLIGDKTLLMRLIQNLVKNGMEARRGSTSHVTVSLRNDLDQIVLDVTDNGDGMDERVRESIETGQTITTKETGSGLGLHIVRYVATHHGAELKILSTPGQGTTFRVVFPRADA